MTHYMADGSMCECLHPLEHSQNIIKNLRALAERIEHERDVFKDKAHESLTHESNAWEYKLAADKAEAALAEVQARLPDGMRDCTILFKECEKGHGWLTATNWVQHGCPHCELAEARRPLEHITRCHDRNHTHDAAWLDRCFPLAGRPAPAHPNPEEVERLRTKLRADPRPAPAEHGEGCPARSGWVGHDCTCPPRVDSRHEVVVTERENFKSALEAAVKFLASMEGDEAPTAEKALRRVAVLDHIRGLLRAAPGLAPAEPQNYEDDTDWLSDPGPIQAENRCDSCGQTFAMRSDYHLHPCPPPAKAITASLDDLLKVKCPWCAGNTLATGKDWLCSECPSAASR